MPYLLSTGKSIYLIILKSRNKMKEQNTTEKTLRIENQKLI